MLVDEWVPFKLVRLLTGHAFTTAQQRGWGSFKNGRLLALAESEFYLFLTCDRNLEFKWRGLQAASSQATETRRPSEASF